MTDWVLDTFFEDRRSRSSMFLKSVLPPKLSWNVRSRWMPRSSNRLASMRWTMVAPTWLLMSSPMIGRPAALKRSSHSGVEARKTGMQLTKPQPASITAEA